MAVHTSYASVRAAMPPLAAKKEVNKYELFTKIDSICNG